MTLKTNAIDQPVSSGVAKVGTWYGMHRPNQLFTVLNPKGLIEHSNILLKQSKYSIKAVSWPGFVPQAIPTNLAMPLSLSGYVTEPEWLCH